jgi:hypothetical protein
VTTEKGGPPANSKAKQAGKEQGNDIPLHCHSPKNRYSDFTISGAPFAATKSGIAAFNEPGLFSNLDRHGIDSIKRRE